LPTSSSDPVCIRPFRDGDQAAARTLILDGLRERWGAIDPTRNPDLDDLAAAFAGGAFFLAERDGKLVGTGGWIPATDGTAEIRRMWVARGLRRTGIGGAILRRLIAAIRNSGRRRVVLETTSAWTDAVAFYCKHGFAVTHRQEGDTYFVRELGPSSASMV
jgi:GNAT superfamily N-acetyltransferase